MVFSISDIFLFRCFGDIMQCTTGYSFAIWLQVDSSMFDNNNAKYIISSGGQTRSIGIGGFGILIKDRMLLIELKERIQSPKEWTKAIHVNGDQQFHLGGTWEAYGNLKVYVNGTVVSTVSSSTCAPSNNNRTTFMHIGKANNGEKYCNFTVDEWYFWSYLLDEKSVRIMYEWY